jgi:hypothetical protein
MVCAQLAFGHHSSIGIYDEANLVEIEGVVSAVHWRNPHASYSVAVTNANGATVEWFIETGSISTLRLRGVDRNFIEVGDRVRLAGQSSLRGRPEMFAENMLLDDGQEVLLRAVSKPYWPAGHGGNIYERGVDENRAAEGERLADGLFRIWTRKTQRRGPQKYGRRASPAYRRSSGPTSEPVCRQRPWPVSCRRAKRPRIARDHDAPKSCAAVDRGARPTT